MDRYPKRLIEVDLPIKRISEQARREKEMRRGHVPLLHIWWATRPPSACRAIICAAHWPDPADPLCENSFREMARIWMQKWATDYLGLLGEESFKRFVEIQKHPEKLSNNIELRYALLDFIADFANPDNSIKREYLETSRELILAAHTALGGSQHTKPLIVDSFAGGGAIPLESLRVGAETFASELNPVAVLLNKMVLEYIPKYGDELIKEVKIWGNWLKEKSEKELKQFYPKGDDGSIPIAYLWARTILSEAPDPSEIPVEIPLMRSMWLVRKRGKPIALRWIRDKTGKVKTKEMKVVYADRTERKVRWPLLELFEPKSAKEVEQGTIARSSATCPVTGYTIPASHVRSQFKNRSGGANDARLLAIASIRPGQQGRYYRLPTNKDLQAIDAAKLELERRKQSHNGIFPLIPDEELPYLRSIFNINLLDVSTWGSLFTSRQSLSLTTLVRLIQEAGNLMQTQQYDSGLALSIKTCLAFILDKMADINCSLATWQINAELPAHLFTRQAIGIIWDFTEACPIAGASGSIDSSMKRLIDGIENLYTSIPSCGTVGFFSATDHPLPNSSADIFFTDPPYYDAVPYADLSDFFYVWLKRTIGSNYPELFREVLTPKHGEIVQLAERNPKYSYKTHEYYETLMTKAMAEGRRILNPGGIAIVVFAHKSTSGWEALLQAMINAGWIITGSWPIDTEMRNRLRAMNSATLSSSVHLVCRPRENPDGSVRAEEMGDWRDVLQDLPRRIHEWMPRLAEEGVVGADAIFACLGPALEIFSRYSRVEKANGEAVTLKEYLEQVWAAVAKEALTMIFTGADATGFEEDARLTAMWLWTLKTEDANGGDGESDEEDSGDEEEGSGKKVVGGVFVLEYDAARKIAQGLGAHLERLPTVVEIKGETARLLSVGERAATLFGKEARRQKEQPKKKKAQPSLFVVMDEVKEETTEWEIRSGKIGETVLDRLHQSMILFGAGRGEALRRFLVDDGAGRDQRFWRLAQAFSALYPAGTDEKRWVDGVLARKKGLGF